MNKDMDNMFQKIGIDRDAPFTPATAVSTSRGEITLDQVIFDGIEKCEAYISSIFSQLKKKNKHIKLPLGIRKFDNEFKLLKP
jgi:hypothetical protein